MHKTLLIATTMIFLVLAVVLSPELALQASLSGISVWWNLVFPALLPFLMLYEFMLAFGLIHGINALLAPFITRLLKLPPAAGLPLIMSLCSGFPSGVEPAVKLLQENKLSLAQAERLISYIHLPNPIFIVVILGSGVFHLPLYGYIILLSVWIAAFLLMILHAQWQSRDHTEQAATPKAKLSFLTELQFGQSLDGRSFGRVLGDSVSSSVQKLFVIGGFIIFASVIAAFLKPITSFLFPSLPFIEQALLEQHIGSFAIANWSSQQQSIVTALALIAACLSFTGLSGLLQVSYYCSSIGVSMLRFLRYRIVHAVFSFIVLVMLWKPLHYIFNRWQGASKTTLYITHPSATIEFNLAKIWLPSLFICLLLFIFAALTHLSKNIKNRH